MFIEYLELKNFRPFEKLDIRFSSGMNLILGKNGIGKTSILEAIHYLTITRSFRTIKDKNVINFEKEYFDINGAFRKNNTECDIVRLYYSKTEGKHLFFNKKHFEKFSDYIGYVPCTTLTPDDLKLSVGSPLNRRRFIDIILSQISPLYLQELKTYKRVIQQKNKLLSGNDKHTIYNQLQVWNKKQAQASSHIMRKRDELIYYFKENLSDYYNLFSPKDETLISAKYLSSLERTDLNSSHFETSIEHQLQRVRNEEIEQQISIYGPHRDDIVFYKNGKSFREYASQGENKTLVIALKLLERDYVSANANQYPILLLDDIFGELDDERIESLIAQLDRQSQTIITSAQENKFEVTEKINKINLS